MKRLRLSGLPLFWATMLLLIATLIAAQAMTVALFVFADPPRPDFNRLSDVADALAARPHEQSDRERALLVADRQPAPRRMQGMTSDDRFTARLADRVGVPPARIRFYFEPDQRLDRSSHPRRGSRMVFRRRGEPIFFGAIVGAVDTGDGWRVAKTPSEPWLNPWQRRMLLSFLLTALMVSPFAWFFARRLTRPISRFAAAADRMGSDPLSPRVPEEGPAELRVTAHALNRMQDRLADYVAERTAMIGAIAHDLRTPLARIAFRIEGAPEPMRDKVQEDIEQMRAMIAATIGFVRGTARSEIAPVALHDLIGRLVDGEQEIGRPVRLAGVEAAMVMGDRLSLERLFQNLIDNGIAYGEAVEISLSREGDDVVACVMDRGPGLPPDRVDRVFDPFERGDPSRNRATGGIGLGLTIARSITQDHGGTIRLADREGGGLKAIVTLPLRKAGVDT